MPKMRLHRVRSKGRLYVYAWRGGPRLHAPEGTAEFQREYRAAMEDANAPRHGTIHKLIAEFKASAEFQRLAEPTRREYTRHLDVIQIRFGDAPLTAFDDKRIRGRIRTWRDTMKDRPRTADYAMATLKRLLSFGVENGDLRDNLARGFKGLHSADRADIVWTEADLKAIAKHASPALQQAIDLARLTGLRRGDLVKLEWGHHKGDWIEFRTSKRGKPAVIPIIRETKAVLVGIGGKREGVVLRNTRGRPWTPDGLSTAFQRARTEAKVKKRWHDLRGTAVTAFCIAGFDDREVAEIVGWSKERVAAIRRKYVDRAAIIKAAIKRVDGKAGVKPPVKRAAKKSAK